MVESSSRAGFLPWLKTFENRIVTAQGQEVILRGANVMRSEWQADLNSSWEERAIPELAARWRGNVLIRGFASSPVNSGHAGYLGMLDEVVSLAETHRMYIILAWRSYDINGEQPAMPDEEARRALVSLAARYQGRSHVMYALQVEPHNDDTGSGDASWHTLRPLFEAMVDEIRRAAAPFEPLVLIPGTNWSRDITGAVSDPVTRPNVVYKSHPYNPSGDFQALFGTAHDAGLPVFIGEFGPKELNDPVNVMTMEDVTALLAFTRQRNIGWTAWLLDFETYALMNSDDLSPTTPYGESIRTEMLTTPPIAGEATIDLVIYADTLGGGWVDWSWNTTVNFGNPAPVYSGSASMSVTFDTGWAGLYLHTDKMIGTASYSDIRFHLHGGPTGNQQIQFCTYDSDNKPSTAVPLSVQADIWNPVNVPLSALGNPATISGLVWQDGSGHVQPVFYIDQISLTKRTNA